MAAFFRILSKNGLTPLKLEHMLMFLLGVSLVGLSGPTYQSATAVGKVMILIIYLGFLIGVAPLPMPVFRSKFAQTMFAGLISGVLDSFIVLAQCKRLKTVESGQSENSIGDDEEQLTEGVRAKLLALMTMAALIGGLIIWFGEVYAAGLYLNDGRTGILSALYILPPVVVFLTLLSFHATRLPVIVVVSVGQKVNIREIVEFSAGVIILLLTHNPALCLGWLLIYAVLTRQDDHLLDVWRYHTEINVMLVLLIALIAGKWLVTSVISPLHLGTGQIIPILPAAIQAVLWGPLYHDPDVHFWVRLTTLSTGAMLLPISSLVGVMLFKSFRQWAIYMKFSIAYAVVWYLIMRAWIALFPPNGSALGQLLEYFAHSGGVHH